MLVVGEGHFAAQDILQTSPPAMAAFIRSQTVKYSAIGGSLHVHVERGINLQAALVGLIAAGPALKIWPYFFNKIRRQRIGGGGGLEADGLRAPRRRRLGRCVPVFEQRADPQGQAL